MAKTIAQQLGKKGHLHKATGTPEGKKIPLSKLNTLAKGKGANAKQAQLLLKLAGSRMKKG